MIADVIIVIATTAMMTAAMGIGAITIIVVIVGERRFR